MAVEITHFLPGLSAFFITLATTPIVRWMATRHKWVARRREDRWHKKETALVGGIAIFAGIIFPTAFLLDLGNIWRGIPDFSLSHPMLPLPVVIFSGTLFFFVLGLVDDFSPLKPQSKLIGQIIAASIVTFLGFRLNWFTSLTLDTIVSLVWIIGITNAFNLLDNMDGLCAGVAMTAAVSMAILYGAIAADAFVLTLILAGACGAFLIYNFNPASIFMGDCGSLVIGFCTAILSMAYGTYASAYNLSAIMVPLLLLSVPILDTTLVTVVRILSGRKASTGGKDHTSHRLVLMGFSEKQAVLFLYGIGAVSGFSAIFTARSDTFTTPAVILPIAFSIVLTGIYLSQLRVYPEKEFSVLRESTFARTFVDVTYKRQIVTILLDLGLVSFSYYLSFRIRFSDDAFVFYFQSFLKSLPVIIAVKLLVFYFSGVYKGFWRYLSTSDFFLYIRSAAIATAFSMGCIVVLYRFQNFSLSIFLIDWIVTTSLLVVTRGSFRFFKETVKRGALSNGDPVLIYGAGRGGELLLREILNNGQLHLNPVGFIDDDPLKTGKNIQGFPVLGGIEKLMEFGKKYAIKGVLVSFHGARDDTVLPETEKCCRAAGWFLKRFAIRLETMIPESTDKPHDKQKIHN